MPNHEITLALWSLHRELESGQLNILDVPELVRSEWNISTIEHVSRLLKGQTADVIPELKKRCADAGVRNALIMIDWEGELGNPDPVDKMPVVQLSSIHALTRICSLAGDILGLHPPPCGASA